MLFLLQGGNRVAARKKLHAVIGQLLTKYPEMPQTAIDAENFVPEELGALIAGQGLFEKRRLVVFDTVLELGEEAIVEALAAMQDSPNAFLFLDEAVATPLLKKFEKAGAQVFSFPAAEAKREFNVFALTDALGSRDRKRLWIEYRKAVEKEGDDDSFLLYVISMLFWQAKNMLLASSAGSAAEAGMKPFPFQKAKQALKNYSPEELRSLSSKLISIPHDARRGLHDLAVSLERFVLSI